MIEIIVENPYKKMKQMQCPKSLRKIAGMCVEGFIITYDVMKSSFVGTDLNNEPDRQVARKPETADTKTADTKEELINGKSTGLSRYYMYISPHM